MKYLTLFSILITVTCRAQTWPDSTCPDKPYTKGGDDIIYHTCDCGVKDSVLQVGTGYTIAQRKIRKTCGEFYCPVCHGITDAFHISAIKRSTGKSFNKMMDDAVKQGCPVDFDFSTLSPIHQKQSVKTVGKEDFEERWCTISDGQGHILHKYVDSLYCSMCKRVLPWHHVADRINIGWMNLDQDDHGHYAITPLGLTIINDDIIAVKTPTLKTSATWTSATH